MSGDYFIGVDARELERLREQHAAWRPETEALWRAAGFALGQHLADLGCGPGFTTLPLARLVESTGRVTALDKAEAYLDHLDTEAKRLGYAHVRTSADDLTQLPSFGENLDGAFCRFFLAFLIADLDRVLATVHRSLRPGGVFAAMEYLTLDSTTATPELRGFDAHTRAWIAYYRRHGGDTSVGQCLPAKLERAGFTIVHRTCVGGMANPAHRWWGWWGRLIADFGEKLVAEDLMTREALRQLTADWAAASQRKQSFIHTPLLLQIVARKNYVR